MTADVLGPTTMWARTQDGMRVHRSECRHARNAAPWHWAEDKTEAEVRALPGEYPWLRLCRVCLPPETFPLLSSRNQGSRNE